MSMKIRNLLVGTIIALILLSMSTFVVDQRQAAIVFQLGEVMRLETTPGLKFKVPLLQNVRFFDSRILTLDSAEPERFITAEKKNVLVDSYVKWRIFDVKQYYISVGGDEARAQTRLMQTVNSALREEFGKLTIHDVVSGKRDALMRVVQEKTDGDARKIGVEVLDVRLKRVDFPVEISGSVYSRMEAERKRVANELRATGNAESEKIRADADKQRQVLLANAYRDAQKIKGEGDAKATALYAAAFGRNTEFFSFYRSLEAYKQTFRDKNDVMVIDPSSAFFKYLKNSGKSTQ
ncbi:MAG: protease modulator HflC [Gammaproteobacteria bacterium]|nr:protease modulator HflC [Sideroxydans sp.]MBU3904076.1 protease modulator HflC [Gammaproteobacteria bacterium]MBU4046020.1 protease modulator HflC [Gammaproteobacteria bacterium]MBU4150595.1 protease modulator HflC [Gammaproteobacteria bacterium]